MLFLPRLQINMELRFDGENAMVHPYLQLLIWIIPHSLID